MIEKNGPRAKSTLVTCFYSGIKRSLPLGCLGVTRQQTEPNRMAGGLGTCSSLPLAFVMPSSLLLLFAQCFINSIGCHSPNANNHDSDNHYNAQDKIDLLPVDSATFHQAHFGTDSLRFRSSEHSWGTLVEHETFQAFSTQKLLRSGSVRTFPPNGTRLHDAITFDEFMSLVDQGMSYVFRVEDLDPRSRPFHKMQSHLETYIGAPISVHVYVSSPTARVLAPHTDPYDVMVFQIKGDKHWSTCLPRNLPDVGEHLSVAEECLLQELLVHSIRGCTAYSLESVSRDLKCSEFDMTPGDVLYMPRGLVHHALTGSNSRSIHVTIGMFLIRWETALQSLIWLCGAQFRTPLTDAIALLNHYMSLPISIKLHTNISPIWLRCVSDPQHCETSIDRLIADFNRYTGKFLEWIVGLDPLQRLTIHPSLLFSNTNPLAYCGRQNSSIGTAINLLAWVRQSTKPNSVLPAFPWVTSGFVRTFEESSIGDSDTSCNRFEGWVLECPNQIRSRCSALVVHLTCFDFCSSRPGWECTEGYPAQALSCRSASEISSCNTPGANICICEQTTQDEANNISATSMIETQDNSNSSPLLRALAHRAHQQPHLRESPTDK
eukprot:c5829_g1_i1.p1 GENE.c5829_g1_i1~~c5829_g1_i1.p1  ORF type:complete len:605 (+),score=99.04 c5829_g1_i1:708-2522(+)